MPQSDDAAKHIKDLPADESHKKGCVTKHQGKFRKNTCAYRYQGYLANADGGAKQARYELDFTLPENAARLRMGPSSELKIGFENLISNYRTPEDPRTNKDAWKFIGRNYKVGYIPFNHNYHHIMPFDALQQLGYDDLKLLQEATYNLNSGENLIILPCLDTHADALMLPAHPDNHPKYITDVKKEITGLKQDILEQAQDHKLTTETAGNLKTRLVDWEVAEYDEIVKFGAKKAKAKLSAVIDDTPIASMRNLLSGT
ncbi:AHH domain-containing protein [Corallococcus terminator]